jgi:outer membrane lipase/esterase
MMAKTYRTMVAGGIGLAAILSMGSATAQSALDVWVDNAANGATASQRSIGHAVASTCRTLAQQGGLALPENTARRDLYLRCNEMVVTADVLNGNPTVGRRSLGYTQAAQLRAALQQVSGEELAAQGSLSTQVSSGQFANISGRLNALRFGGASAASRGRVAALDSQPHNHELHADNSNLPRLGAGASSDAGADRRWGWFVESSYGFGDHDQTDSEDAFDFDSVSVSTGTDYNFGSAVLGFSAGFDNYKADFDNATLVSGGDVEVKGVSGSLFGAYFGESWSVNGIATYGSLDSDVTRRAQYVSLNAGCSPVCGASRELKGSPDGSYVALGVTLSRDFSAGGWDITPSLTGSYRDVDIDSYSETDTFANGGLALAYDDQAIESKRAIVGVALSRPISKAFGVLTPNARVEWHHEFEDDPRVLRAKYQVETDLGLSAQNNFSCAVSCFAFSTGPVDSDFAVAGVGLSATFAQRLQAYAYYEMLLGVENLSSNSIALGIRGSF